MVPLSARNTFELVSEEEHLKNLVDGKSKSKSGGEITPASWLPGEWATKGNIVSLEPIRPHVVGKLKEAHCFIPLISSSEFTVAYIK